MRSEKDENAARETEVPRDTIFVRLIFSTIKREKEEKDYGKKKEEDF